jgi:LmbE family N-acetylglucosaminyl deacetylase
VIAVVSTHLDDAVFSCWSVLTGPEEVRVLTVFTGVPPGVQSPWDGDVPSDVRGAERIAEDRAALALAGREPVHVGLYDEAFEMGEQPIAETLAPLLEDAETVYAPLAFQNTDHMRVRDAVLSLRPDAVLYVDLPYAISSVPPAEVPGRRREDVDLSPGELERKLEACRCYAGELPRLRMHGDFLADPRMGRETFWFLKLSAARTT